MNKTTKTISYITVILMISKVFGFAREMVTAYYYGASWQTDAFNMAFNIIGLSTAIISMGVSTVVVPMYNHRLVQKGKEDADTFASNILCITSVIYGILSALGMIFAPVLMKLMAPNFDGTTAELSIQLLRVLFIFTIAINAVNFLSAISRSNSRFLVPALVGFPLNISTVLFISILSRHIGIYAMVIGYIVAYLIQIVMIVISLRKAFKFKAILNFTNGDVKDIAKLSVPIFVSIGVDQLNAVIDRMLASGLVEGSITAMNYAQKLRGLPDGIITASIITVIFPMFSQYAAKRDFGNLKALASKAMSMLFAVMTPITLVCVYYSKEIVKIVYERGAFTHEETALTAYIFIFTILALFFIGGSQVLNNAFYGMQDTKTPRLGAVISVSSNIVLNLILVRYMQAAGLALATSIACMLNYIILLIFFRRKSGSFGGLAFIRNIIKCTLAAVAMLPVFLICEVFRDKLPTIIFWGISVLLGLIFYAIFLYVMKVDIFMFGLEKVKGLLRIGAKKKTNDKNSKNETALNFSELESSERINIFEISKESEANNEIPENDADALKTYILPDMSEQQSQITNLPVTIQQPYIITPKRTKTINFKPLQWYHIVMIVLVVVNIIFLIFNPVKLNNIKVGLSDPDQNNNIATTENYSNPQETHGESSGFSETESLDTSETSETTVLSEATEIFEVIETSDSQEETETESETTTQTATATTTDQAAVVNPPTTTPPYIVEPTAAPPPTTTQAPTTTTDVPTTTEVPTTPTPTTTEEFTIEITTSNTPLATPETTIPITTVAETIEPITTESPTTTAEDTFPIFMTDEMTAEEDIIETESFDIIDLIKDLFSKSKLN